MLTHYYIKFTFRGEEVKAYVTKYPDGQQLVAPISEAILQDYCGVLGFDEEKQYTGTYQRNEEATDLVTLVRAIGGQLR